MHAFDGGKCSFCVEGGFPCEDSGNEGEWEGASRLEGTVLLFF